MLFAFSFEIDSQPNIGGQGGNNPPTPDVNFSYSNVRAIFGLNYCSDGVQVYHGSQETKVAHQEMINKERLMSIHVHPEQQLLIQLQKLFKDEGLSSFYVMFLGSLCCA